MSTIKKYVFISLGILLVFALIIFIRVNTEDSVISKNIVQLDEGWGYEILINNKVYIFQKYIPAVEGNKKFKSKNDAIKICDLVIRKLKHKLSPTITKKEIIKLRIN